MKIAIIVTNSGLVLSLGFDLENAIANLPEGTEGRDAPIKQALPGVRQVDKLAWTWVRDDMATKIETEGGDIGWRWDAEIDAIAPLF